MSLLKNRKCRLILILLLVTSLQVSGQEQDSTKSTWKFTARGYVKDLQYATFSINPDTLLFESLLHNRLNFRLTKGTHFTAALELRNRLFAGENTRSQPGLAAILDHDQGFFDLSWILSKSPAMIVSSQLDRVWLEWNKIKWNIRVGRQRINWGINTVWNPNDIFNAFNYIDFDYEERLGNDALRIQYQTSDDAGFDLAISPGKDSLHHNAALLYRFNKWHYDFQVLGGISNGDLVGGLGFAGNLGTAGLKGEISYFYPYYFNLDNVTENVSASFSVDYAFRWGLYVNASMLYSSNGASKMKAQQSPLPWYNLDISAKYLMPTRYSYFLDVSGNIHPLVRVDIATIYGPGLDIFFFMPSLSYSMADNIDVMLLGQLFYDSSSGTFRNMGNGVFLRLKWSF